MLISECSKAGRSVRWRAFAILVGIAGVLAVVFLRDPATALYPPCLFHALTGLHCPGCGSLRALHQLLHGSPARAFGLNPLLIVVLPILGYAVISQFSMLIRRRPLPEPAPCPRLIWGLLGAIVIYWAVRNIPAYPFCLLAP